MTTQTKHFIELADIVALRIDCKNKSCGASICLLVSRSLRLERIRSCPSCGQPWLNLPTGASIEPPVKRCIDSIKEAVDTLRSWEEKMNAANCDGFSLALEIRAPLTKATGNDVAPEPSPSSEGQ